MLALTAVLTPHWLRYILHFTANLRLLSETRSLETFSLTVVLTSYWLTYILKFTVLQRKELETGQFSDFCQRRKTLTETFTMITNKRQTLKRFSAIFTCMFVTSGLLVNVQDDRLVRETTGSRNSHSVNITEYTMKSKASPPFIYLTQTEQCLTPGLIQTLELSDASKCRCDVIVLSYKTECREKSEPHITYLFGNETTWGSGRNQLYFQAVQRRLDYLYYIFLDDDITLKFSEAATPEMKRLTSISVFQDWLLDYEPAVGVGDYEGHDGSSTLRSRMRRVCNKRVDKKTMLANPTILFDPLFNAFHAKAVSHIFPMEISHEERNWWLTDKYVASVVELKFRGQALMFFPVAVVNLLHRPYPQSSHGTNKAWQGFIEAIQEKAPTQFKYHALIRTFRRSPRVYIQKSRTYCMGITRHQDITPFAHLASRWTVRNQARFS